MRTKQRVDYDSRKEMILGACLEVFADKGISATTKELAAAAGVSEALLYKHFKSKEDLFSEVKTHCCNQVHQHAEQLHTVEEAFERLTVAIILLNHSILIGFEEDQISKKQVHKLILHSLSADGEFAVQMFSNFKRWVPFISGDMEACREKDFLQRSPSTDERLLWMVHHFILGIAIVRLPKTQMEIFDIEARKLVFETSVQSLVMLGSSHANAVSAIETIYKDQNKLEKFNFLKG